LSDITTVVAFVAVTVRVEEPPSAMLLGVANTVTLGPPVLAVTVTVAVAVVVPPTPVAVAV
jgi:hypothetical protein